MVTFPKPTVPVVPVRVKKMVVVAVDGLDTMEAFVICDLVTFPARLRLIVLPLSVVALMLVRFGVGVSVGAVV